MASNNEREPLLNSINSNYNSQTSNESTINRDSVQIPYLNNSSRQILSGVIVLFLVLLERIAYYSLTGNLYLFLNEVDFQWIYYNAINALLIFTGTSYLSSLFGGWLSDAYLGRFKTIFLAFVLFTVAYWFLPYMSEICHLCKSCMIPITPGYDIPEKPLFKENCSWPVMVILIIAAIGTGTIKANITPFGAEQVKYTGSDGLRLYLNWLYWCVNIGSLVAILGITYVQQFYGFKNGYLIPVILLTFATAIFLITYPIYTHRPSCGSSISRTFSVLKDAWKLNKVHGRNIRLQSDNSVDSINRPSWLDMAKVRYGGKFHDSIVEDVKSLYVIIIVFISLIPYWMVYFQMQSTFLAQGLQMRLSFSSANDTKGDTDDSVFSIPAAWLMLFNVLFLIIFIPLMNHVIYPWLDRRGMQLNILTRMTIGMFCATMSMIVAGCLEICRLHLIEEGRTVNQTIENRVFVAADLQIMWQIPQYSLIGISEVFTSVSGMEFACSQAPTTMQGAVMGLYYFCTGIGSFVGVASLAVFEKIDSLVDIRSSDINKGNLYYYFFFLALVQFITLVLFSVISKKLRVRRMPSPNPSVSRILGGNSTRSRQ